MAKRDIHADTEHQQEGKEGSAMRDHLPPKCYGEQGRCCIKLNGDVRIKEQGADKNRSGVLYSTVGRLCHDWYHNQSYGESVV